MRFSRQEYWSELPFLSPEDLLNPGVETESVKKKKRKNKQKKKTKQKKETESPVYAALQADILPAEPLRKPSLP